jgi:2-polyprenyl-3-methyl-5-hydroxy-6-metoxy-1,4-benzoquinol methylase
MTDKELDQARVEAFAGQMLGIMNGAALALMTSIGHQTGLFDTMAGLPPSTSQQIAEEAGLNERYVREWLGALVTGRIVDYDPAAGTYSLPKEHAAALTRAAGPGNMAAVTQFIAMYGPVEEKVIESFRNGGGVPYSAYPRFPRLMAEMSSQTFDSSLLNVTLPLVPGLIPRLEAGIDVADLGCGCGHAVNLMAQAFPSSRITGYDFEEESVTAARAEAAQMGLTNARFEMKDVSELNTPGQYDLITAFDAIHDQAHPARVLEGIASGLRSEGTLLMVDIAASSNLHENLDHPMGPFLYANSTMRCMTISLGLGGEGLGTMWGEQKARQMLAEAGFSRVAVESAPGNLNNCYIASKG